MIGKIEPSMIVWLVLRSLTSWVTYARSKQIFSLYKVSLVSLLLLGVRCFGDDATAVIVHNDTSVSVKVDILVVPLDNNGTDIFSYQENSMSPISPGEDRRILTLIDPERKYGIQGKILVAAVAESEEVVYQRLFTWDELNSMEWRVVIEPQ